MSTGDENSPDAPCANARPAANQDTHATSRDGGLFGSHMQTLAHLQRANRNNCTDIQLLRARQQLCEIRRNRDAQLHAVSHRLAETRARREQLEQQRQRIHSRFLRAREQGPGGAGVHAQHQRTQAVWNPVPRQHAQLLMDVALRGHAAIERVEHVIRLMVPMVPQDRRHILQGRIERVERAAAALAHGLIQPDEDDDSRSDDTQVWYWTAAPDVDEVSSLPQPAARD